MVNAGLVHLMECHTRAAASLAVAPESKFPPLEDKLLLATNKSKH